MQKKKRTALEATIDVVGRDQQDQILYLKKDVYKRQTYTCGSPLVQMVKVPFFCGFRAFCSARYALTAFACSSAGLRCV